MARRPNASENSAREDLPPWGLDVLHARGALRVAGRSPTDAVCMDVEGPRVWLVPVEPADELPQLADVTAEFRVPTRSGVLSTRGRLTGPLPFALPSGVAYHGYALHVSPDGVRRINRRAYYRLAVTLKGEMVVLEGLDLLEGDAASGRAESPSRLTALTETLRDRKVPCVVRDIGLGGVRLGVAEPPPARGSRLVLDVRLGPGETLCGLPGRVLEARTGVYPPPFPGEIRVRFDTLPRRLQDRLSRFIVQAQMELIRRGIRP